MKNVSIGSPSIPANELIIAIDGNSVVNSNVKVKSQYEVNLNDKRQCQIELTISDIISPKSSTEHQTIVVEVVIRKLPSLNIIRNYTVKLSCSWHEFDELI